MNVYGLMASIRVSSDKDSIAAIEAYVAERLAAKDREIGELKADLRRQVDWNMQTMSNREMDKELVNSLRSEIERLKEGLERISKSKEYEGFLLVSPSLVEPLLENPAPVDNSMQQYGENP